MVQQIRTVADSTRGEEVVAELWYKMNPKAGDAVSFVDHHRFLASLF
jgi:hypothetical protein